MALAELAKLQEKLVDEAAEAERQKSDIEDEAALARIEEELRRLEDQQQHYEALTLEVTQTKQSTAEQAEALAAQAEELAMIRAQEAECAAGSRSHDPRLTLGPSLLEHGAT